jgi:abortive infection bacteriophage resistance protein
VIDGIERVEVSVKTQLVYEFSHLYGPFGHLNKNHLSKIPPHKHAKFIYTIKKETDRSNEIFVKHFFAKYGDKHQYLPLWMTAELMSFGTMLTFFRAVSPAVKRKIAAFYNIPYQLLFKWLIVLNGVRNTCAHHGRLWNKKYSLSLPSQRKYPDWYRPVQIPQDRIFGILTILKYMLGIIAPQSQWPQRLQDLLLKYPNIPLKPMGCPANWKDSPLWR